VKSGSLKWGRGGVQFAFVHRYGWTKRDKQKPQSLFLPIDSTAQGQKDMKAKVL
jgi:hypothetical protein